MMAVRLLRIAGVLLLICPVLFAQTTTAPGIDVEIYSTTTGTNELCVNPGESFTAHVLIRPGDGSTSCTPACGTAVPGGSSAIATGVVDVAFDKAVLLSTAALANPNTVAAHGLMQDNTADGRIGWALAGNWSIPGDPSSTLLDPCEMAYLSVTGWMFRMHFQAKAGASGLTVLTLRDQNSPDPFALSFADICGSDAFTQANGAVDQVRGATIVVTENCSEVIFFDSFETGASGRWTATAGK